MLQSKGKEYSNVASAFRELAAEDEEVLASVLIGFTNWLLTTKRLACLNMTHTKIKTSYFFGEIQRYRFVVDKLAQEQFWITANGEPEKKLGTIGEIAPQFIELFNSTLGVAESPKTPSPERIEASVDTAVTHTSNNDRARENAQKFLNTLPEGEVVEGYFNLASGDFVVTSERVGVWETSGTRSFRFQAPRKKVTSITLSDSKNVIRLFLNLEGGSEFKVGVLAHAVDESMISALFESELGEIAGVEAPRIEVIRKSSGVLKDALTSEQRASAIDRARLQKERAESEALGAEMAGAKRETNTLDRAGLKKEKAAEELRRFGKTTYQGFIGTKQVTFYEQGYVRVSFIGLKGISEFEKLLAIDGDIDNVVKKTGLGRGAGAVLTLGLNTLTPNKRGDIYLTIVTENTVHTLHTDFAASTNIKEVKRMEQVGKALIARSKVAPDAPQAEALPSQEPAIPSQATGLVADLEALKKMVDSGVLSQEEFEAAKRKLLESP